MNNVGQGKERFRAGLLVALVKHQRPANLELADLNGLHDTAVAKGKTRFHSC